ncbi:MAG: tetratricopeptide repeat protein, partial [Elusimicrobiota bacterium]
MNRVQKYLIYILLLFPPLVFFTDLTRNPYYFQIFLLNELLLIFWIIFLAISIKTGRLKWSYSPVDLPRVFFFGFAIFTWLFALVLKQAYPIPEIIEEGRKVKGIEVDFLKASMFSEGFKKAVFTIINVLMAYFITSSFIKTSLQVQEREKFFNATYNLLIFVGFIAAFYAILQYFMVEFIWAKALNPFGGRPVSTFGNPNFMSSYLLVLFPVIAVYCFTKTSKYAKLIYFITMAVYFMAIVSTMTRSTWIGLFVTAALMFYFTLKYLYISFLKREMKWVGAVIVMTLVVFVSWPRSEGGHTPISRVIEIREAQERSYGPVHQRFLIWSCAWDMVRDQPLFGRGWGLYELFYPFYQGKYLADELLRRWRTHANNAHNEILEIWSQTGTIGMGFYLWFMLSLFIYALKVSKSINGEKKLFPLAMISGTLGMFVDNLTGNVSIHFCVPAFLYWWNIGMISNMDESRKENAFRLKGPGKIVFGVMIVVFLFFMWKWYNFFMGEVNYFKGFKYSKNNNLPAAVNYLEKAHRNNREVNSEYELGNTYARLGNKEKAIWAYYQALCANCGYDEIHFNLATVYTQLLQLEKAINNYSQSLYINPTSQETYLALGNVYLNSIDRYRLSAVKLFERATFFFPVNTDLWNSLGFAYTKTNDIKNAIAAYRKALEANPEFNLARHNLITSLQKAGIKNDPLIEYESLIKKAEQKINEKDWQSVLELSKKIVSIAPKSFKGQFYLANASFTLGQYENAIKHYREALALTPSNLTVLTNLSLAFIQV